MRLDFRAHNILLIEIRSKLIKQGILISVIKNIILIKKYIYQQTKFILLKY